MAFVWVQKASPKKRRVRREKVTVTYRRLSQLGKQMGAAINVDLVRGIQAFKKRVPRDVLAEAFKSGDYLAALRVVPWEKLPEDLQLVFSQLFNTVDKASAIQIEKLPPNINERLRFDTANPTIRNFLGRRTAELVTNIEEDTRANIRDVIASSFTQAQTPRQLADRIKGSIGLLPAHEQALANYKRGLEEDGRSAKDVERLGDKYEARLLDYRAKMIARTETRAAIVSGQLSVWREGRKQGLIEHARKEWVVDGAPCDICEPMDEVTVDLDEPFIVDGEEVDGPPEPHPSCQCGLELHFADTVGEEAETEED